LIEFYEGRGQGSTLPPKLWTKIREAQIAGHTTPEIDAAYREMESINQQRSITDAVSQALSPLTPDFSNYAPDEAVEIRAQPLVAQREMQQLLEDHGTRVETFKNNHADFEEVFGKFSEMDVHPAVYEAVMRMDDGPEVLYRAAKEGNIKRLLNPRNPVEAVAELGRISARLEGDVGKRSVATVNPPKPATPVRKVSPTRTLDINDPDLPFSEFVKERNRQIGARRGH
jgi:hypothetical protein